MLYAKIFPAAQITVQDGPFSTKVEIVEFVTIGVQSYNMGDDPATFIVTYGNPAFYDNIYRGFNPKYQQRLILEAADLAEWGTDDSLMFEIIGDKQGFAVVEIFDTTSITTTTTTTTKTI
jgi:hypothetical protein